MPEADTNKPVEVEWLDERNLLRVLVRTLDQHHSVDAEYCLDTAFEIVDGLREEGAGVACLPDEGEVAILPAGTKVFLLRNESDQVLGAFTAFDAARQAGIEHGDRDFEADPAENDVELAWRDGRHLDLPTVEGFRAGSDYVYIRYFIEELEVDS